MAGSNAYTMSMLSAMNENPDEKIQEYDMNQNRKKKVRPKLSLTADPYYEAEKAKSMNKNNTTSAYGASSQGNTGWTTHRTTDGRAYYAHEELGTTWVKPTDLYEKNASVQELQHFSVAMQQSMTTQAAVYKLNVIQRKV